MTGIEADAREITENIREITENAREITEKLDLLLDERENTVLTRLSERSLSAFLSHEPDLYAIGDAGAVYR